MQLHEVKPIEKNKKRRRIGRGGKRGTYSGKGLKGQKSRAGRRIRPALRDLISRLPKHKGFKNKPKSPKPLTVTLHALERMKGVVDLTRLQKEGIISRRYRGGVKIIGKESLTQAIVVRGLLLSKGAKESIEKAGGRVESPS